MAGAALGVVPALFTFGLSIPVGAAIGGCVGTVTGGGAGVVGGGVAGYGGFTYKDEIASRAGWALDEARSKATLLSNRVKGLTQSK